MPPPEFRRYALYYTPPPGPLAEFGAAWLGWDSAAGRALAHPQQIRGLPAPIADLTQEPRRYGFHATLKAPFRLHPATSPEALQEALTAFCAAQAPLLLAGVTMTQMGRFLALTATGDTGALQQLAAESVRQFDRFRARPNTTEAARHQGPHLNRAQLAHARRWGYPYVLDQFRWHMTLTGKRPRLQIPHIKAALAPVLAPLLPHPFPIDAISLVGEDPEGNFHLIHRAELSR